jgi:hypothetical protein
MTDPPIQVFGYHGTSKEKAKTILSEGFRVSDNDYDWLGEGVYFFQDAPYRAMQWANQLHPQHPPVIRAVIQLDNCIDLLDIKMLDFDKATKILTEHFANLTPDEFEVNLRKYCPELFTESTDNLDNIRGNDLYRQGHQDGKLQIIPKLLDKGLSTQEVAELLELDLHKVEETSAQGI